MIPRLLRNMINVSAFRISALWKEVVKPPLRNLSCDYAGAMHGLCWGYVVNLPGKRSEYRGAGAGETCSLLRKGRRARREGRERQEREDIEEREERTNMNAGRRRSPRAWLCRQATNSTHIER